VVTNARDAVRPDRNAAVAPAPPDEMEESLRQRLEGLPRPARAKLFRVLRLPRLRPADRIGEVWGTRRRVSSLSADRLRGDARRRVRHLPAETTGFESVRELNTP
jgi:hypothetical protein